MNNIEFELTLPDGSKLSKNDKVNFMTTLNPKHKTGTVACFKPKEGAYGWMQVKYGTESEWVSVNNQIKHFGVDGIKVTGK